MRKFLNFEFVEANLYLGVLTNFFLSLLQNYETFLLRNHFNLGILWFNKKKTYAQKLNLPRRCFFQH